MSKYHFLLLSFFFICQVYGQIIPKHWEGTWKGSAKSWAYNNQIDTFQMSIKIIPKDSAWDFTLFYDRAYQGQPDIRQYRLIIEDSSKYHLVIDEKNSIFLDCFINDNCMYERFSGMGSDLQISMCIDGSQMEYEITSYYTDPLRVSGNKITQQDTVPEIRSFELHYLLKGKLNKVDK